MPLGKFRRKRDRIVAVDGIEVVGGSLDKLVPEIIRLLEAKEHAVVLETLVPPGFGRLYARNALAVARWRHRIDTPRQHQRRRRRRRRRIEIGGDLAARDACDVTITQGNAENKTTACLTNHNHWGSRIHHL